MTNNSIISCINGYYYNSTNNKCESCNNKYGEGCKICNSNKCISCKNII